MISLLCLTACGDKSSKANKEATVVETTEAAKEGKKSKAPEKIKDCEDFLDTYEVWANDLIELMAKHKDDPVTLATSPDYTTTMMKGVGFMEDWATISVSCAMNEGYSRRMDDIQQQLEEKQVELGLK